MKTQRWSHLHIETENKKKNIRKLVRHVKMIRAKCVHIHRNDFEIIVHIKSSFAIIQSSEKAVGEKKWLNESLSVVSALLSQRKTWKVCLPLLRWIGSAGQRLCGRTFLIILTPWTIIDVIYRECQTARFEWALLHIRSNKTSFAVYLHMKSMEMCPSPATSSSTIHWTFHSFTVFSLDIFGSAQRDFLFASLCSCLLVCCISRRYIFHINFQSLRSICFRDVVMRPAAQSHAMPYHSHSICMCAMDAGPASSFHSLTLQMLTRRTRCYRRNTYGMRAGLEMAVVGLLQRKYASWMTSFFFCSTQNQQNGTLFPMLLIIYNGIQQANMASGSGCCRK